MLLRPLVQDTLFPTVCYVAGPNELAYLAQLRGVYEAFGVPMPLMQQRASATMLDSNAMRFLARHELPLESLRAQDEAALNQLLEAQIPPAVEHVARRGRRGRLAERMEALAEAVAQLDPTLEGAARSTLGRMQDDLKKLHGRSSRPPSGRTRRCAGSSSTPRRRRFPAASPRSGKSASSTS